MAWYADGHFCMWLLNDTFTVLKLIPLSFIIKKKQILVVMYDEDMEDNGKMGDVEKKVRLGTGVRDAAVNTTNK